MDKNNFEPNKETRFKVTSGKLIVADPNKIGYPQDLTDKLREIQPLVANRFFITFPYGLFYYTVDTEYCGTDCMVGVFYEGGDIIIQRNDCLVLKKTSPRMGMFNERVVDAKTYQKLKNPIFEAAVDSCNLLIGDAEKYSLPESDWIVDNSYIRDELKEGFEKWMKGKIKEIYRQQVLQIPNGIYTIDHIFQEEKLILRSLKK